MVEGAGEDYGGIGAGEADGGRGIGVEGDAGVLAFHLLAHESSRPPVGALRGGIVVVHLPPAVLEYRGAVGEDHDDRRQEDEAGDAELLEVAQPVTAARAAQVGNGLPLLDAVLPVLRLRGDHLLLVEALELREGVGALLLTGHFDEVLF